MSAQAVKGLPELLVLAADAVASSAAELNRLDSFAGDGDLGITMSAAAEALKEALAANEKEDTDKLLAACGAALARRAPSTSGTLLATGFLRASKAARAGGDGVSTLANAFRLAQEGVQARGKAAVGDRTIVDALQAVCSSLQASASANAEVAVALAAAAEAAARTAEETAQMEPRIGRASWVPERAKGHPDAGCAMLAIALRAAAAGAAGY